MRAKVPKSYMYLIKTPNLVCRCYPQFTWRVPDAPKKLFLTFDDGPIPEITPWVAEELARFGARATFFVVGENVDRHPDIVDRLREAGHTVGSHTWNHLNGWTTENREYYENVRRCAERIGSRLFRPPYGRLGPRQARFLQKRYDIIMWDVLSGDFDPGITAQRCLHNILNHATGGSIIVLHDSLKAAGKLRYVLPRVLDHYSKLGFTFEALEEEYPKNIRSKKMSIF